MQNVKKLLDAYNYGGMTGQQEIDLMMAASNYITKYSTGKKAVHKGRTEAMEEILYQLTMHGGTKETADRKVDDIINTKITQNKYDNLVKITLESMKGIYSDNSKYSKSLQMIAADVLSRADNVLYVNGGYRSGFRDVPEGNEIDARMTESKDSAQDTTFHEFTHLANSSAYGNIMGISYLPDETTEGINDILTQHENIFKHYTEAGGDPDDRDYAVSWWSNEKYTEGNEGAFNDYLQEGRIDQNTYNDKMAKLARLKELFHMEKDSNNLRGTNSITEHDAVVNQLLLRMENKGETDKSKKSHLYRLLKAAALDSLVRRRGAAIKRKMGNRR